MRGSLGDQALKRVGARQIEFTSSSFLVESASDAATKFAGDEVGNVYSRSTNPTVRRFELRLAALGGGVNMRLRLLRVFQRFLPCA